MSGKGLGLGTGSLPACALAIALVFGLTGCWFDDEKTAAPTIPTTGGSGSSGGVR